MKFPYSNFHDLNTDWIISKIKELTAKVEALGSGGGGGGTSDFNQLSNRPSYNSTTMTNATDVPVVKTTTWDAKYDKPSGGIPKTDLASSVQTSLGLADTALQSAPVTSVNGQTGTVVLDAHDVGALTSLDDINATKLKTARTIGIGTGATGTATSFDGSSNITIPITSIYGNYINRPTYITAGNINAFDFPIVDLVSAPRSAFLPGTQITVEYSTDGGTTWTDYGMTTASKAQLCNLQNNGRVYLGGPSAATVTTNFRARITLYADANCTYSQTASERYARISMAYIYLSDCGHKLSCEISRARRNNLSSFDVMVSERTVAGWSGPNIANFSAIPWGGSNNQPSTYGAVRFTFAVTDVNSSFITSKPSISGLRLYGDTSWTSPNNMMKNGHMYNWDDSQNVTFPAAVTATTFSGSATLTGTPTAPTASTSTNNTQIATTAFVKSAISGLATKSVALSVTIDVADWNGGTTCTKTATGVTASNNVIVTADSSSWVAVGENQVRVSAQAADSLTFTAESTPSDDLTFKVLILG